MSTRQEETLVEQHAQCEIVNNDAMRLVTSQLTNRVHAAMLHSHVVVKDVDANITRLTDEFILQHEELLQSFFESLRLSREYEEEYNQRMALLNECELAASSYFAEHGQHVENMEKMQAESAEMYSRTVENMTTSLQTIAEDLVRTSIANKHNLDLSARQREHPLSKNELLQELLEMEKRLKKIRKTHQFGESDTKQLEEAITLHSHRLDVAYTQNAQLKSQIKELSDKICKARETNDVKAPLPEQTNEFENRSSALTDEMINESESNSYFINTIANTRRSLDEAMQEVKELKNLHTKLEHEYVNLLSSSTNTVKNYNECDKLLALPERLHNIENKLQATKEDSFTNAVFNPLHSNTEQAVRRIVRNAMMELNTSLQQVFPAKRHGGECSLNRKSNYCEINSKTTNTNVRGNKCYDVNHEVDDHIETDNQGNKERVLPLERLMELNDMHKLKAVQNYIVSAVNRKVNIHVLTEEYLEELEEWE